MKRILFIWKRIPTTVIVLERDPERVFHVKNKLLPKIRGLQWFPAIDGEKKNNLTDLIHQYHLWVKPGLRTGQIGCALSHMQVWSQFVNNPRRDHFMVVLEDDSLLKPDYDQDLQEILREVPFYFDWVYLYVFPKHYRDDEEVQIPGKKVLNKAYNTYCTVGYLISRQGAKKLLQRLKRIDMPLDTIISDEIRQGKLIAFSSKKVIVKNMGQQTSAIEKLGGMPSNVWGTHYFVEQNKIEL